MVTEQIKSMGLNWLVHQGVSTVLLFAIMAMIWKGTPYVLDRVDTQVKSINESAEKRTQEAIKAFESDQARDAELIDNLLQARGITVEGPAVVSLLPLPRRLPQDPVDLLHPRLHGLLGLPPRRRSAPGALAGRRRRRPARSIRIRAGR